MSTFRNRIKNIISKKLNLFNRTSKYSVYPNCSSILPSQHRDSEKQINDKKGKNIPTHQQIKLWSYSKGLDVYFVMKVSLRSNHFTIYSELACISRDPYQGDGMEFCTPLVYKLVKKPTGSGFINIILIG